MNNYNRRIKLIDSIVLDKTLAIINPKSERYETNYLEYRDNYPIIGIQTTNVILKLPNKDRNLLISIDDVVLLQPLYLNNIKKK